jgi:hypothetical protein
MLTTSHVDSDSQMDGDVSVVAVLTLALLLEEATKCYGCVAVGVGSS